MFKKRKKKTVKLTEETLKASVITSMYILSDGLAWHLAGQEEEPHNPLVMASPEEIAETIAKYIFWEPSSRSEDSSSSPTAS